MRPWRKSEATTYDEALALADAAAAGQQWDEAFANTTWPCNLPTSKTNRGPTAFGKRSPKCQYMLVRDLYGEGKVDECLKSATSIARRRPTATAAAQAALAVRPR